jgi:hypothetical protein
MGLVDQYADAPFLSGFVEAITGRLATTGDLGRDAGSVERSAALS